MKFAFLLVVAALTLVAGCAPMQSHDMSVSCEILKSGIVSNTYVRSEPNAQTTSGVLRFVTDIRVVEETLRVPLQKDISFGIQYRFTNLPEGARVVQVISHPVMLKPDGSTSTGSRREKEPGPGFSYILNHDYELVPGEWRFEYWHNGKKLCGQKFELYST